MFLACARQIIPVKLYFRQAVECPTCVYLGSHFLKDFKSIAVKLLGICQLSHRQPEVAEINQVDSESPFVAAGTVDGQGLLKFGARSGEVSFRREHDRQIAQYSSGLVLIPYFTVHR